MLNNRTPYYAKLDVNSDGTAMVEVFGLDVAGTLHMIRPDGMLVVKLTSPSEYRVFDILKDSVAEPVGDETVWRFRVKQVCSIPARNTEIRATLVLRGMVQTDRRMTNEA